MAKRVSLAVFLLLTCLAAADEGMWLFNTFPKDKTKTKYGFAPSQEWLDHVRLSSVRFNNGGSGSFVSADGLTFTNHHVGAKCLQELSTEQRDYMKAGFYARSREEEARCPDLELNVLREIDDVTARVRGAERPGMPAAEIGKAQRAAMSAIEEECTRKTGLRCDVVKLYAGGLYHLYKYKKYTDVRLVFAPEFDIAFFGGDPDNFTYPRYDLDIAFFRIYENDTPVKLEHYLKWANGGVREGELVFVSGNPGGTDRNQTVAQLDFLREVEYPFLVESLKERIKMLEQFSSKSGEHARKAQRDLFSLENGFKAYSGEYQALREKALIDGKATEERGLRAFVTADPKLKAEVGGAWEEIEQSVKVHREIFLPYVFLERRAGFRGTLNRIARDLFRLGAERQKPNSDRLREYRESALDSLKQTLLSTAPIYKDLETAIFAHSLGEMKRRLGNEHPVVKQVLGDKSPEEAARELIAGTKLDDV
ncbi:MAG TPA: S46 family peptidase, partial [Terriglobales bacterium]|nr:S46 family peptidase [Terriglobales bacterium]